MKDFITEIMNEKEIKEGLNLFKKYLKKITFTHADPMQENCYISSSDIIGVYFPNTQFEDKGHKSYKITSVSKVGGVLGVVFAKRDDLPNDALSRLLSDYIFTSLDELVYSPSFRKIRARIQRNIEDYSKTLQAINDIKVITRKNGEPFAQVLKNFESPRQLKFDYEYFTDRVSSLKLGYDTLTMYRAEKDKEENHEPTLEEVKNLIAKYKTLYEGYIENEKKELKNLERNFNEYMKIAVDLAKMRNKTSHFYTFEEELKDMARFEAK